MLKSILALLHLVGWSAGLVVAGAVLTLAWVGVAYVDRHLFDSDLLGYQRLQDPITGCQWVRVGRYIYQRLDESGEPVCIIYGGGSADEL